MTAPATPFIGLTGAIASGKSATLAALARLGAETLSTDEVAHGILDAPDVRAQLESRWGEEIVVEGIVDRKRVGQIVFEDADKLRWLESVTHPAVGRAVVDWRAGLEPAAPLGVVEVPLLYEAGMESFFDGVLVVVAGERRAGWLAERGDEGAEGRTGRQMTEEEKASRATWVVANDGSLENLDQKLGALWPELVAAGETRG